jgi:hypothetical protein
MKLLPDFMVPMWRKTLATAWSVPAGTALLRWVIAWHGCSSACGGSDGERQLINATYGSDPRIRLVKNVDSSAFPAAFRATLPAGWRPSPRFLASVTANMDKTLQGRALL